MKQPKKLSTFFLLIVLLTLIMAVLSLMLGKVTVSFKSVIEAFDSSIVNNEVNIVRARMPRTIFALLMFIIRFRGTDAINYQKSHCGS